MRLKPVRILLVIGLFISWLLIIPNPSYAADSCPSSGSITTDTTWTQQEMLNGKFDCSETDLVIDGATLYLKLESEYEFEDASSIMDVRNLTFKNGGDIKIQVTSDIFLVQAVTEIVETVGTPQGAAEVAVGTGVGIQVLSIVTLLSLPNTTAASIIGLIAQAFLGRRHLKNLWGLVYNSKTGKPVAFAIIRLRDAESNSIISTTVSDLDGRYGFPANIGTYLLEVGHDEFVFPSKQIESSYSEKEGYVYTGGKFTIKQDTNIDFSIPLDPKDEKFAFSFQFLKRLWSKLKTLVLQGNYFFLAFMFVLNLFATVLQFNLINLVFTIVYFALIALKLLSSTKKPRAWGYVYDSETKAPVSPSFLKLFKAENRVLIDTKVANRNGVFQFFVPENEYLLLASATGYKFPSESIPRDKLAFHESLMKVNAMRGVVSIDIPLDYQGGQSVSPFSGTVS